MIWHVECMLNYDYWHYNILYRLLLLIVCCYIFIHYIMESICSDGRIQKRKRGHPLKLIDSGNLSCCYKF